MAPVDFYGRQLSGKSARTHRVDRQLGPERTRRLKKLSQNQELRLIGQDLTLYTIFLTLLFAYLYRISGQSTLRIGSPFHNRPTAAFKETIGLFIEIGVIQVEISPEETFISLLQKVRDEIYTDLRYAQPGISSAEQNRAYNVLLNYIHAAFPDFDGMPTQSEWPHSGYGDSNHALRLQVHDLDQAGNISLQFELNEEVFEPTERRRVAEHFVKLLDAFLDTRDQPLTQIDLLPAEERQTVQSFSQTLEVTPAYPTIVQYFEAQVSKSPEAVAVAVEGHQLTYRELNRRVNQLAHYLRRQGVKPDMVVGLCLDRSLEMIVGILGILKAGGAYLPLDPHHPADRLGFMLADAQVSILLTQKSVLDQLPDHQADTFCLDADWPTIAQESRQNPPPLVSPHHLAYVIYTSGSTGQPKGALVEHKNVVNLVTGLHHRVYSQYPTGLKVALVAPYVFDASVQQIFAALLLGHSLHIVPEETRLNGKGLFDFYQSHKIDLSDGTPAHLDLITNSVNHEPRLKVRHFIIGGEALLPQTVARFFDTFKNDSFKVTNIYGPAECCVDSVAYELTKEGVGQLTTIPIGTPMPNEQIYILNEAQALQPVGMPGEICISGQGVGRGYLNRDDLTAQKFGQNPFLPDQKLYRTGDIGRYLPDGQIEFVGRKDTQIKIRGYRIELGEIENRLKQFTKDLNQIGYFTTQIDEAAVVDRVDEAGHKYLCAYYVAGKALTATELRAHLQETLPDYMIPSRFIRVEAIPLNHNGKVDKQALPAPTADRPDLEAAFVAPNTEIEEILAEIWTEILTVERIGIYDNFFDLGGASLQAVQMLTQISQSFQLELPLQAVFETPTIASLGKHIEELLIAELESISDDEAEFLLTGS